MAPVNDDQDLIEYQSDQEEEQEQKLNVNHTQNTAGYVGIHSTGFKDFLLKPEINRAITEAGFEAPSEVQQECIPSSLLGSDMLCQAKSGMGKTAVFCLTVLQRLEKEPNGLKCLVLCHTRELAYQIHKEFIRLGKYLKEIKCKVIYGGAESIEDHKRELKAEMPTIVVGTPGRVLDLVKKDILNLDKLQYFILDECDKMLEQLDMRGDVQQIFKATPHDKQVMMFSATMNKEVRVICRRFMQKQVEIFIDDEAKLTLHGLLQFYLNISESLKNRKLSDLLDALEFNQVIIFVSSVQRAIHLNNLLCGCNFPSIAIHSGFKQEERIMKYKQFKEFQKRIMVATDVLSRGVDFEKVNIVINYDMPDKSDTYLHRVNRAARFGTKGLAITFVTTSAEKEILEEIQNRFVVKINELPDSIDKSQYMNN